MLGSKQCLARAAELERRAEAAMNAAAKADFIKAAEGWRDLARRTATLERREGRCQD
jgi:deoxyribose-phosphate aldolase